MASSPPRPRMPRRCGRRAAAAATARRAATSLAVVFFSSPSFPPWESARARARSLPPSPHPFRALHLPLVSPLPLVVCGSHRSYCFGGRSARWREGSAAGAGGQRSRAREPMRYFFGGTERQPARPAPGVPARSCAPELACAWAHAPVLCAHGRRRGRACLRTHGRHSSRQWRWSCGGGTMLVGASRCSFLAIGHAVPQRQPHFAVLTPLALCRLAAARVCA